MGHEVRKISLLKLALIELKNLLSYSWKMSSEDTTYSPD